MVLQKIIYALNQFPICGTVSPTTSIYRARNQEVEKGIIQLIVSPSDTLVKSFLLFPQSKEILLP